MKKTLYISIFFIFNIWNISYSQDSEKQKKYIEKDTSFISELKKAYDVSCEDFFEKLEIPYRKRENLGFGYQIIDSGKGLGSISFDYQILFLNDEILAYNISTEINENKSDRIKKLYKDKLSGIFEVDENYKVSPLSSDMNKIYISLNPKKEFLDNTVNELMNPFFSRTYGTMCGEAMRTLDNRKLFDQFICEENCEYLLYSMNPATRIMSIEFYYSNLNKFNKAQQKIINLRIEELKNEPLIMEICSGCIYSGKSSNKIISELANSR
ncbi:hypothetical protein DFQ10_1261 [Winogradskyella eximia]|uniref:Uncharacterized protein n=1 Tax=Winogradskyella eximia TaxID=262006 RepID=A0A3D9GRD9_9FLAO|nr:hypothetical protein [Winogradskyella eximia]RED37665.1 hypothetical protein DFQ10_1261 [Winogradskyella eximia]